MARTRLPSKGRPALPHHGRVLFDCGVGALAGRRNTQLSLW